MRILILQSGSLEHFLSASRAVRVRYPDAELVGLVRASDLREADAAGSFARLEPLPLEIEPEPLPVVGERPFDLCVVPFESRLGVYHWRFRRIPIASRIPAVISYNGRGRLREWRLVPWVLSSLFICVGIRAIHRPAVWAWGYLRRWLDMIGLYGLAVVALTLFGLRRIGWNPFSRSRAKRLPTGRRRLVLFIPSLGLGGAQRQVVSFLTHLDREQWDPELVMLDLPDKFFEPAARDLGVPITYLNARYEFWMVGVVWRLARHLVARPCHVLHCWMHYAAMLGAVAGSLAGVPIVIGSLRSERPGRFPWFYPKWQRGIDMLTAPLQTRFIANSNAVREDNRRWALIPQRKFLTISNGIDIDAAAPDGAQQQRLRAALNLPAEGPLVGIVGRLWPEKDHTTFLQAACLVGLTRREARFLIVGDGDRRQDLEREIEWMGLSDRVLLLGERKDALAIIRMLDVLVLTSTTEGFPNVLLEASSVGTPVVTTAAGGAAEVVLNGETGFVVPCGDAEAVAGRVLELLGDPALRKRFADAALARVRQHFSARRAAKEIQACYAHCVQNHETRRDAGRRLRVCFLSTNAYGLLEPKSGLAWGGAEVQICTLAQHLAADPRFEVFLLSGDQGRQGTERHGRMTVLLSALFTKLQVSDQTVCAAGSTESRTAGEPFAEAVWTRAARHIRCWLDRLPPGAASTIRWPIRKGYACRNFLTPPFIRALRGWASRLRECQEFVRWVRELRAVNADVYVMRCAAPQVGYVQGACALLRRRFVYMVAHEIDVSGAYAGNHGIWGKRFEGGLRRADAVVCQHEDQMALLKSHYRREGRLIRSLCPVPVHTGAVKPRRLILWVARLDAWKQPELFLELANRMPEADFVMVGPPSIIDVEVLPRLQERMAGLPNLQWLSRMSFEGTAALFEEALLFVNTSQAEGFPNTFLQAAACGTPIVSWAVNPHGMLDRFQFGYCAERDWSRFEQSVRRLHSDSSLRELLGDNGRRYVREHHDPAAIAREYGELFFTLAEGPAVMEREDRP